MQLTHWKRFRWDLTRLEGALNIADHYTIRAAQKDELDAIKKVISSAFSMDMAWTNAFKTLTPDLLKFIEDQFPEHAENTQVILHGSRIIGVSVIHPHSEAANHLITGPSILHEYRNRGLGSALLKASLEMLQKSGLTHAFGVTVDRSVAARFVYPKFQATIEDYGTGMRLGIPQAA